MNTQQKKIIEYLIENKQIGNYWASHNYILRLSERIRELEAKGWKFVKGYFNEKQSKNYIYKLIKKGKI